MRRCGPVLADRELPVEAVECLQERYRIGVASAFTDAFQIVRRAQPVDQGLRYRRVDIVVALDHQRRGAAGGWRLHGLSWVQD